MLILKEQDYRLFLTFITTDDPEKNVARVTLPYETGTTTGHYVAPDKVRERYHRTLALLTPRSPKLPMPSTSTTIQSISKPKLQAVIERDAQFSVSPDAKDWVIQRLVHPLQQRERELDQMIVALEKDGHQVGDADELNGTYKGAVLLKNALLPGPVG